MRADVLTEDATGSDLVDDAGDVRPQPALVVGAAPLSGVGFALAGIARSDEIHDATPRSAVKSGKVVPDRCRIQGRRFHPGHEGGRGIGFPLDVTDNAMPGRGDADPELESAAPGT